MKHLIPEFEALRRRFPPGFDSSLAMPCLHRIQEDHGYISEEDIAGLVEWLKVVPRVQIEEVLSFYGMFRRAPAGRVHIETCRNVSCSLVGAERLIDRVSTKLGIKPGEATPDGKFSLSTCECLGSCGTGPVFVVNGKYRESMTPEKVDALIEELGHG
jgi:NADH-quinone oxidoreductase subunit E